MSHLEEQLSAFIDGELGHSERERVLSHLARCEPCRFEAAMLRQLKQRLCTLRPPEPASEFLTRLLALPEATTGDPPAPPSGFGASPPLGAGQPLGGLPLPRPARRPAPARGLFRFRGEWGRARYAVAGVSMLAAALGTAFLAGGDPAEPPVVTPALTDYAIEHAAVSGQSPLGDPATVPVVTRPLSPHDAPTVQVVQTVNRGVMRSDTPEHR